ncbi:MAG: hypothetical protein AB1422_11755 [bacterium]
MGKDKDSHQGNLLSPATLKLLTNLACLLNIRQAGQRYFPVCINNLLCYLIYFYVFSANSCVSAVNYYLNGYRISFIPNH